MTNAKNVDEYIAEQKEALVKNPACASTHYNLGVGYLSKRMFREAEEEFLAAIENSPKLAEAYVQLGGIAMQRGDLDSCLRYNQLAVKQLPTFAVPYANIGFVHMQRGEAKEAIDAFKKAIKRDPKFIQAYANLGGILYMNGNLDESLEYSAKALELNPNFGPAYGNMALAYLEKKDFAKAKVTMDKASALGFEVPADMRAEIETGAAGA